MASIKKYATAKGTAWRVQYRSPDGRSRTKQGFRTKNEAQAWAEKNATAVREGDWIDPNAGRAKLSTLWHVWKASQHHLAESSLMALTSSWDTHINPRWGGVPISSIKPLDVQRWVNSLVEAGKSPTVVQRAFHLLSNLCAMAVRDGLLRRNPCDGIRLPSKSRAKLTTLTPQQVELLIRTTKRYQSLVVFLAYTGARWGEAAALTVGDLELERGRAVISKSVVKTESGLVIGEVKNRKARVIALPPIVVDALRDVVRGKLPSALLWTNQRGGFVTTPSKRSWWHTAVSECQAVDETFPSVTPHDLRHAAASILISAGASVLVVQRQLGHSSAKVTLDKYSHLFEDDLDAVAAAVSTVVGLSWKSLKSAG